MILTTILIDALIILGSLVAGLGLAAGAYALMARLTRKPYKSKFDEPTYGISPVVTSSIDHEVNEWFAELKRTRGF